MKENRTVKYGRMYACLINYVVESIPEQQREDYRKRFIEELKKYSFKARKKGEPRNEGCIRELDDLAEIDIENPEHLARLVKEGIHLMYQKGTASRVLSSLLEKLG